MYSKTRKYRGGNVENCNNWFKTNNGTRDDYSNCDDMIKNGIIFKPKSMFSFSKTLPLHIK